jgi:kynureninase
MVAAAASGSWTPPTLPAAVLDAVEAAQVPCFEGSDNTLGHAMRDAHFGLDPSWTFINHGAFGAACSVGTAAATAWRQHAERQPLQFIDRELFAHLVESQRVVAEWIGASPAETVLMPNATSGLNAVIASVVDNLEEGDEVLFCDVGYGSVARMIGRACRRSGARPVEVPIAADLPESAAVSTILERVASSLTTRTRIAIFDDVTSNHALAMPLAALCALCREQGVLTLVDGAHSPGSRPDSRLPYLAYADLVCPLRGSNPGLALDSPWTRLASCLCSLLHCSTAPLLHCSLPAA